MRGSPADTCVINTRAFALVGDAIKLLTCRNGIVAVVGQPGTGKSYAARTQLAINGADGLFAITPPSATTRQLLCNLLSAADPTADHVGTEPTLRARLVGTLVGSPLLVVDDAHELDRHCLKLLRRLTLGPDAGCPLLLVGDDRLAEQLVSQPWTRAHSLDLVRAEPLDRYDLVEVLPNYHALYRAADMQALLWIDRTYAHGRWSNWARYTTRAIWLHGRGAFETLDGPGAALVLSYVR